MGHNFKRLRILNTGRPPVIRYVVVALGVTGVVAVMLWTSLLASIENRNNLSLVYSRVIENTLTRTLESVENSLFPLLQDLNADSAKGLDLESLTKRIDNVIFFAPHIRQIVILRDQEMVYDSNKRSKGVVDLNAIRFSQKRTAHMNIGLKIGEPVFGRFLPIVGQEKRKSNRALVPVVMESARPDAKNAYRLIVALNSQYITSIFQKLDHSAGASFGLFRTDGQFLMGQILEERHNDIGRHIQNTVKSGKDEGGRVEKGVLYPVGHEIVRLSNKYPFGIVLKTNHHQSVTLWAEKNMVLIIALIVAMLAVLVATFMLYLDSQKQRLLNKEIELLSAAVHQSPVSILITDRQGRIKYANAAFEKVYGYPLSETLEKTPSIIKSGTTAPEVYDELWEHLGQGKAWQGEFLNKTRDNRLVPTFSAISPVIDETGDYSYIVGLLSDISVQKELQEQAQAATQRAEAANEAKSSFLATMSHELRTPMTGIRGVIDLMKTKTLSENEVSELLEELDLSSNALMMLLNDILDLSKIEAGKLQLEKNPTNPAQVLQNVAHLFRENAQHKEIVLTCQIVGDPTDYWMLSDGLRIRQIMSNLISNAIKFTLAGRVTLKLELETDDTGGTSLRFLVHDTGIGMTKDQLETIFDPFTQADSSTTRKFGGTGLGLTITKQLCERLGGDLQAESEDGVGTTFIVHLPVTLTSAPTLDEDRDVQIENLSILLAEDNVVNQKIVSTMLRKKGHRIDVADNGRIAVDKAHEKVYDIILMDMQMPQMDGLEATRLIRRQSQLNQNTPILAFTADAYPEHHTKFSEAGINDVVTKPVRWNLLEEKLAQHVKA